MTRTGFHPEIHLKTCSCKAQSLFVNHSLDILRTHSGKWYPVYEQKIEFANKVHIEDFTRRRLNGWIMVEKKIHFILVSSCFLSVKQFTVCKVLCQDWITCQSLFSLLIFVMGLHDKVLVAEGASVLISIRALQKLLHIRQEPVPANFKGTHCWTKLSQRTVLVVPLW